MKSVNEHAGSVLAENRDTHILEWHLIKDNLLHPHMPNSACFHLTACGREIGGAPKQERSGHSDCLICYPAIEIIASDGETGLHSD
jgi:hypothetical protein